MSGDPAKSSYRARKRGHAGKSLEDIIRPIVEGQLKAFADAHPSVAEAVDWRFSHDTKLEAFVASSAKRIVNALLCDETLARLRSALKADAPKV